MDAFSVILLIVTGVGLTTFLLRLESWPSNRPAGPFPAGDTAWAMSEENVEIVRRSWEAFLAAMERGDPGAWFDSGLLAQDFEWVITAELEGQSVWRGREGFVEFIRTWTAEFDDWSIRVERLIDAGEDQVVSLTVQTATGKESGVPIEAHIGQVVEVRDARQVRITNYLTHADALEAAGLSE